MSEDTIRQTFSRNLKMYLDKNEKQPVDLVNDLNIPFSTVSNWINGLKMPRMGKVELLAQYLHVEKTDLLEDKTVTQIIPRVKYDSLIEVIDALSKENQDKVMRYAQMLLDTQSIEESVQAAEKKEEMA
jgi:transcriptional regulator with XRE-family HTH domain